MDLTHSHHFRLARGPFRACVTQEKTSRTWGGTQQVTRLVIASLVVLAMAPRTASAQCEQEWAQGYGLPGVDGTVSAMAVFNDGSGDALYVGGSFKIAGDTSVNRLAKWDGTTWSAVGSGVGGAVYALVVFDDGNGPALYAAGKFSSAGGLAVNRIAKWNGSSWSALGAGIGNSTYPWDGDYVAALTVFDDGGGPALYAAGKFITAGGVAANRIAKWDGSTWSALGKGIEGQVHSSSHYPGPSRVAALAVFDDSSGPALYAGGHFTTAGGTSASHLAKWNGTTWAAVGSLSVLTSYAVESMAVFDDGGGPDLYVGGHFHIDGVAGAHNIARWDGMNWSGLGTGIETYGQPPETGLGVLALTVLDDGGGPALHAGGSFFSAGGVSARNVAKWNGMAWSALGTGLQLGPIDYDDYTTAFALVAFDDGDGPALYAGGNFTAAGGVGASKIAKWNDSSWSSVGRGAGIGGSSFREHLDLTIYPHVSALHVFDDGTGSHLFAAGFFTHAGDMRAGSIAKWNGTTWSALASGLHQGFALTTFDDGGGAALYAGTGNSVTKWNGSSWERLGWTCGGGFPQNNVAAMAVFDDGDGPALYAGGLFAAINSEGLSTNANFIAKWNGSTWSTLGSGMDPGGWYSGVYALTVFDDGSGPALYAGGSFLTAGGLIVNSIAKWDGETWSALGSGLKAGSNHASVYTLTVFDDGGGPALYAGGTFKTAGGVSANGVAKWDGESWSALELGMVLNSYSPSVEALTVFDDGNGSALYAAGRFAIAGGGIAGPFARWDGMSWSSLGDATGGAKALASFDDGSGPALYAAGGVITAGDRISALFAKWSCAQWGDMNQDSVVDLTDFAQYLDCFEGPILSVTETACLPGDVDSDLHIDLADFAKVQRAFGW